MSIVASREERNSVAYRGKFAQVCVLLLQDLLQSCARGGRRRVEDMCYERRDDEPRPVWMSLPITH